MFDGLNYNLFGKSRGSHDPGFTTLLLLWLHILLRIVLYDPYLFILDAGGPRHLHSGS